MITVTAQVRSKLISLEKNLLVLLPHGALNLTLSASAIEQGVTPGPNHGAGHSELAQPGESNVCFLPSVQVSQRKGFEVPIDRR